LGHFLAARWRGLKIDRFAIWFGKPIWKTQINGVEYALGWIPAGGYVALPQMATMEAIEGKSESSGQPLPPVSAIDKIIVAFAGPLFSFLLAILFAFVVMNVGRPVSEGEITTTIGYVEKDGPADKVGLRPGDRILEIDGKPVTKFEGMGSSVKWRIISSEGQTVQIKAERDGKILEFFAEPVKEPTKAWQRKSLRQIKIAPAESSMIAEVSANSPAAAAGLQRGDEVVSVDGNRLYHFAALGDYIDSHPNENLTLTVSRKGRTFEVAVKPVKPVSPPDEKPRLGIVWDASGKTMLAHPGTIEQVTSSAVTIYETFSALLARKSDIKPQHLGGAVMIMNVYYRLFSAEHGWRLAIWFSVVLNVNLALLNLLPIPVLDGGHIVLAIIEAIRRKPISARIVGAIQTACAALLIGFMLYIAFYDVQDLPWKRSKEKPVELKFAPKPLQK
jgi:regulator of sigma E protease